MHCLFRNCEKSILDNVAKQAILELRIAINKAKGIQEFKKRV
jgi:hypothetical protein